MEETITIIFAEDHALYRQKVIDDLKEFNIHTVAEAADGLGLLALLRTMRPHLVLLDLEMPGMNGNQALDIIRRDFPGTKVLIMSAHDEAGLVHNYRLRGVQGYVSKSDMAKDIAKLAQAIRTIHTSGLYFPHIGKKLRYSPREVAMIHYLCEGKKTREIAGELGISPKSAEKQRSALYRKTGSRSAAEFFKYVFKKGLEFLGRL